MDDIEKELEDLLAEEDQDGQPAAAKPAGEGTPPSNLPVGVKETFKKLRDDRRAAREEAAAAKAEVEKLKAQQEAAKPKIDENDIEDRVELRLQGYTADEIAFIKRNQAGKSLTETAKDPYVAAAIESLRSKNAVAHATPAPSSRTSIVLPPGKRTKDLNPAERKKLQDEIIAHNRAAVRR